MSEYVDIGGEKSRDGESYVKVGKYKYRAADMKGLLKNYHKNHAPDIDCHNATLDEWLASASNATLTWIPDARGTTMVHVPRGFTPPRSAKGLYEGGDGTGGPFNEAELKDIWNWCQTVDNSDRTTVTRKQRREGGDDMEPPLVELGQHGFRSQTKGGKRLRRTQSRKRPRMSARRRRQSKKSRRRVKHRRTRR